MTTAVAVRKEAHSLQVAMHCTIWPLYAHAALSLVLVVLELTALSEPWFRTTQVFAVVLWPICAITFLRWIYLAYANLKQFVPQEVIPETPRKVVVSWFIPIANLYWPFIAMCDLWGGSDRNAKQKNWLKAPVPIEMKIWWTCWLLPSVISLVDPFFRSAGWLNPIPLIQLSYCIAGVLCARIVMAISQRQLYLLHQATHELAIEAKANE